MNAKVEAPLETLIKDAWGYASSIGATHKGLVQAPSFPVLWFGDLERWFKKPRAKRILTSGVNPGPKTFCKCEEGPNWWGKLTHKSPPELGEYSEALARYMEFLSERPDDFKWFKSYNPLLEAFGTSFSSGRDSAIHTDIFSPLATVEPWSRLSRDQQKTLSEQGLALWTRLIRILQPSVVVLSVRNDQWKTIESSLGASQIRNVFCTRSTKDGNRYPRGRNMRIWIAEASEPVAMTLVVGNKLANKPFQPLDHARLSHVGKRAAHILGFAGAPPARAPVELYEVECRRAVRVGRS
ncbi:MAG TPA: hypothetical protein PLI95_25030 [Polyangiaceae bacterium]|nr:hypothetical protein [Polyangiaceae bacterium]